jgi:hypothetical protein
MLIRKYRLKTEKHRNLSNSPEGRGSHLLRDGSLKLLLDVSLHCIERKSSTLKEMQFYNQSLSKFKLQIRSPVQKVEQQELPNRQHQSSLLCRSSLHVVLSYQTPPLHMNLLLC